MRCAALIIATLVCAPALADERALSGDDIRAALSDKTVEGTSDTGKPYSQIFQKGGLTIYNAGPQASSTGFWDVRGDQYCSQWPPNETWSCYSMTGDGARLTFVAAGGKTWPVKVLAPGGQAN
jgi:hypothetical protein